MFSPGLTFPPRVGGVQLGPTPLSKGGGVDARFGVEVQAARSNGARRFRVGLKVSTALTDVATVTRATQAWGVDQGGNVSAFAAGQPVVTTAGLAVWEARTNLLLRSQALGESPWVAFNISSSNPTVTNNAALAPDGTMTATRIDFPAVSVGQIAALRQALTVTNPSTLAPSIYLRASSPVNMRMRQGNAAAGYTTIAVTTSWQRFEIPSGTTASTLFNFDILVGDTNSSGAVTVYAWGAQLETGSVATPYIPTTSAPVTRNADVITETVNIPVGQAFTVTGRLIAPNNAPGQYPSVFELRDPSGGSLTNALCVHFDGPTNNFYAVCSSAGSGYTYAGGALDQVRAPGTLVGFCLTVEGGVIKWSVNGGADKTVPMPGGAFTAPFVSLSIGCRGGGTQQINAALRDLNVVMRSYSASERAAASDVTLTHDLDFVSQVYQYVGAPYVTPTDLPGTTFSRATSGTDRDSGQIVNFAAGVLKITSAGCLFEAQKTNVVRYSEGTTATIGTWGSGGSAPGDGSGAWAQASTTAGMTISTSAKGTYPDGCDWWEFTLSGTPNATQTTGFYFDATPIAAVAASGQTWVSALDMEFISMTGCTGGSIAVFGRKANGSGNEAGGSVALPTTPTARARYASLPLTLADALTARIAGGVSFSYTSGVPVNIVIRVTAAQVERDYVSSYKKTTGSAVTGNADNLASANDPNPTAYTVVAEFTIPATGPTTALVWQWDDGTANNKSLLYYNRSTGRLYCQVYAGGVVQASLNLGSVVAGNSYKVALRVAANDFAASLGGAAVVTDVSGTVPTTSAFRVGADIPGAGGMWSGNIQRIRRYSVGKTNSELQALAA